MRPAFMLRLAIGGVAAFASSASAEDSKSSDEEQGRVLYREGAQHYNAGEFDLAAAAFEQAYALSHRPNLLFNIAQSYRLAGPTFCGKALEYYERYLRDEPNPPNKEEVQERLRELASCPRDVKPPVPTPVPTTALPTPERAVGAAPPRHAARWIFAGAGALLFAGAVTYGASQVEFQAAKNASIPGAPFLSGWNTAQTASYVVAATGAAGMVAGALVVRF